MQSVSLSQLDNSTAQLLDLLAKMSIQYEATLHNLKTVNSTVFQVLQLLDTSYILDRYIGYVYSDLGTLVYSIYDCRTQG